MTCALVMILLPLMTKPVPDERRTDSKRHGASQTGCWLKLEIWITDLSGDAPNPARSARMRMKLPVNLLNTPEDERALRIGQAREQPFQGLQENSLILESAFLARDIIYVYR